MCKTNFDLKKKIEKWERKKSSQMVGNINAYYLNLFPNFLYQRHVYSDFECIEICNIISQNGDYDIIRCVFTHETP